MIGSGLVNFVVFAAASELQHEPEAAIFGRFAPLKVLNRGHTMPKYMVFNGFQWFTIDFHARQAHVHPSFRQGN